MSWAVQEMIQRSGSSALDGLIDPIGDGGDTVDWPAVERRWGFRFPADYIDFLHTYGKGVFMQYLLILGPEVDGPIDSMAEETENARGSEPLRTDHDVIAWGVDSSGDILCWLVSGEEPDQWPVAVWGRHSSPHWATYECGMVEFLRATISGEFSECPLSGLDLWNTVPVSYLGDREDKRLRSLGLDPWTGEPDPYAGMTFG